MANDVYTPLDGNPFKSLYEEMSPNLYNREKITAIIKRYDDVIPDEFDHERVMGDEIMPLIEEANEWHKNWD